MAPASPDSAAAGGPGPGAMSSRAATEGAATSVGAGAGGAAGVSVAAGTSRGAAERSAGESVSRSAGAGGRAATVARGSVLFGAGRDRACVRAGGSGRGGAGVDFSGSSTIGDGSVAVGGTISDAAGGAASGGGGAMTAAVMAGWLMVRPIHAASPTAITQRAGAAAYPSTRRRRAARSRCSARRHARYRASRSSSCVMSAPSVRRTRTRGCSARRELSKSQRAAISRAHSTSSHAASSRDSA